jgi:hypothetical protein
MVASFVPVMGAVISYGISFGLVVTAYAC